MIDRLFVYGTLAPGKPNDYLLKSILGTWVSATVFGILRDEGWGAELGYPGIELCEHGDIVKGQLLISKHLSSHWERLDNFEGEAYQRVKTKTITTEGETVDAYIYQLRKQ